ncbi:MAG: hypothetical protein AB3N13_03715 [Arenibacterium sp.]
MADMLTPEQKTFVETFLLSGVGNAPEESDPKQFLAVWSKAREAWQDASETVDGQISNLQSVLKGSGDPDLERIAEFGLSAVTGNHRVRLMAAVMDIDRVKGVPSKDMVTNATKQIGALEKHISSDAVVKAVDNNPFKVDVSIVKTLTGATAELKGALRQAVA